MRRRAVKKLLPSTGDILVSTPNSFYRATHVRRAQWFPMPVCPPYTSIVHAQQRIELVLGTAARYLTTALQYVATCRQSPYLHKPAIIIMTSFARLAHWRNGARSPPCHHDRDVILIVTSFATELATPTVTHVRTSYRI